MPEQTITPFGRIRITQVIETWAAESPLNPRLLASELAGVLRTIGPESQPLASDVATVTIFDPSSGTGGLVLLGSLAGYFESYSIGAPAATIETTNGAAHAGAVLIALSWIRQLEVETKDRAKIAAGRVLAGLGAVPTSGSSAQPAGRHQPPPSGSDPECLEIREAQQRREGEASAAEQLDAANTARDAAKRESERLRARLEATEAQLHQARESSESLRRELNEACREITKLTERLDEAEQAARMAEQSAADAAANTAANFKHLEGPLKQITDMVAGTAPKKAAPAQRVALLVVAGLLRLLTGKNRSRYNQGSAADAIAEMGWNGAGVRNVNEVFGVAKKLATDAEVDAKAKAEAIQRSNAAE